jgi:hypothetical protein
MTFQKCLFAVAGGIASLLVNTIQAAESIDSPSWHQPPFRVMAGKAAMDTIDVGGAGHAAPFMVDLDGDDRRDLVVGSIIGKFYFYKNVGTDADPLFGEGGLPLNVGGGSAKVVNWCCMAAAPQFADIDGDGLVDLTAGSYGGPVYWLKGLGGLQFAYPVQLLTDRGSTLLASPATFYDVMPFMAGRGGLLDSYAANVAWVKWNDDEKSDLIIGNNGGQLFVWTAQDDNTGYSFPGLPVFKRKVLQKDRAAPIEFLGSSEKTPYPDRRPVNEILIAGEKALPEDERHSAPAVADWDGDGLWDILAGSFSGRVYFLRNTGKPGTPEFKTREVILEAGKGVQWLAAHDAGGPGTRSQVQVVDYNLDGKLDLLVGYYSESRVPRKDLTKAQRKELQGIREQLAKLNVQAGNFNDEVPAKAVNRSDEAGRTLYKQINELEKKVVPLLEPVQETDSAYVKNAKQHGQVWVYLRK